MDLRKNTETKAMQKTARVMVRRFGDKQMKDTKI